MKKILITGAGGFIGSHMAAYLNSKIKSNPELGLQLYLQYRANMERIKDIPHFLLQFDLNGDYPEMPKFDYIVHFASNADVQASIEDCTAHVKDNLSGTARFFEWIKQEQKQAKVCLFSSDEVLGPAKKGESFSETAPLKPSNPYSATKAGQEMLAHAFAHSFGLDIFIVRSMNVYGKHESEWKFIGKVLNWIDKGEKIILHGKSKEDVASRHWVHAKDIASAVWFLLQKAQPKEIYHIAGEEIDVYTLASKLYLLMKGSQLDDSQVEFVDYHSARKGHDRRYSLSNDKILKMGWKPKVKIDEGLKEVVEYHRIRTSRG